MTEIKKHISDDDKKRIVKIHEKGYKISIISDMFEISDRTVNRIILKNKQEKSIKRKNGTGSKAKYDKNIIRDKITNIIKNNRGITLEEIKIILANDHKIIYSKSQIHNIMKEELKYVKKKAKLKIPLSEDH